MALAPVQRIVQAGLAPAYATPLASENITPARRLFLHVKNANAAPCVVTPDDTGRTAAGSAAVDPAVSVPATTGDRMIPLPLSLVNPSTGLIVVTFSVTTSVTAALIQGAED